MKKGRLELALIAALVFHGFIGYLFFSTSTSQQAVLHQGQAPIALTAPEELDEEPSKPIQAVSVDAKDLEAAVNQLKSERAKAQEQAMLHQRELDRRAAQAERARATAQKKLAALKEEAKQAAQLHQKQVKEEKARLEKLAQERIKETKQLETLKQRQQALIQAQAEEASRQKQAALDKTAAEASAARAEMAGEVNRYKALILRAIGAHWIIPDNADKNLSSQFHIRLAPDGAVLAVQLVRSSGDPILDRSAQTAIYKASPLPVPASPDLFNVFRDNLLTVRPMRVRG